MLLSLKPRSAFPLNFIEYKTRALSLAENHETAKSGPEFFLQFQISNISVNFKLILYILIAIPFVVIFFFTIQPTELKIM